MIKVIMVLMAPVIPIIMSGEPKLQKQSPNIIAPLTAPIIPLIK